MRVIKRNVELNSAIVGVFFQSLVSEMYAYVYVYKQGTDLEQ